MRTTRDVRRSVQKYIYDALGPEWEVRSDDEQGMITLPFCRVRRTAPIVMTGPAHTTMSVASFALHLTPVPSETSAAAYEEAERIEELLVSAFRGGVGLGRPNRIPLYDYDGIPGDSTSMVRGYADYIRIETFSTSQLPDMDNPNSVNVTCDLRVGWARPGYQDTSGKRVEDVTITPSP